MVINHNMSAMFAQRSQGLTDLANQKSMEKLSSGMRINRAGDDALEIVNLCVSQITKAKTGKTIDFCHFWVCFGSRRGLPPVKNLAATPSF